MGRPSALEKLTDEQRGMILAEVRGGASPTSAAALADVHFTTWYNWMRAGSEGKAPYADFSKSVEIAERAWVADQEKAITSSPDWRARGWMLERRKRLEYGNHTQVDVNLNRTAGEMGDDELATIAAGGSTPAGGGG